MTAETDQKSDCFVCGDTAGGECMVDHPIPAPVQQPPSGWMDRPCPECQGTGRFGDVPCGTCEGEEERQ